MTDLPDWRASLDRLYRLAEKATNHDQAAYEAVIQDQMDVEWTIETLMERIDASRDVGYREGGSNADAGWQCAMNEIVGVPEEIAWEPDAAARWIEAALVVVREQLTEVADLVEAFDDEAAGCWDGESEHSAGMSDAFAQARDMLRACLETTEEKP